MPRTPPNPALVRLLSGLRSPGTSGPFINREHSGRAPLQFGASFATRRITRVCNWSAPNGYASQLALAVDTNFQGILSNMSLTAGEGLVNGTHISTQGPKGRLHINYGLGNKEGVRDIDIRPGSYQLPPCTACEVFVEMWDGSGGGGFPGFVSCALGEGRLGHAAAEPTNTVEVLNSLWVAASSVTHNRAPGARFFTANSPDPTAQFTQNGGTASKTLVQYDATIPLRFPNQPRWDISPIGVVPSLSYLNGGAAAIIEFESIQFIEF